MDSAVYQIENQENGNRYIGSAVSFKKRHTPETRAKMSESQKARWHKSS